jgi:deazaflavin-dependent oxidoreductase (nitroreductase family)
VSTATANTDAARRRDRPLLGLRRKPGRLALGVFRLPLPLYHRGWGRLLGHTFLLFTHAGRKSGSPYDAVAMVLRYDPHTREAVICAAWGEDTQWVRNIRARPALRVQIGRKTYVPEQRFLGEDEAVEVVTEFRQRHRGRVRLITTILGWDIRTDTAVREFVRARPFVAFRPAAHDQ